MSDSQLALLAAACTAILALLSLPKRPWPIKLVAIGLAFVGIYASVVQEHRSSEIHKTIAERLQRTEPTQQSPNQQTERAAIKQAVMAIVGRGTDFLRKSQTPAHAFATGSIINSNFDNVICGLIRSDAFVQREKALSHLPGEDQIGARASYESKDCPASLPAILTELNTLAKKL